MNLPQVLYLDLKKWRCGSYGPISHYLGTGSTNLCNLYNHQCCLGQFIQQTDPNLHIKGVKTPVSVLNINIPELVLNNKNTQFTKNCMQINDDEITTIEQKIELLKQECKKIDRTLVITEMEE